MSFPLLFLPAAAVLVAIPGPNHLYIVTRSLAEGRRSGLASALGVETGTLVHVAAAAAGLSALVAASATAFSMVRYAGAAYLFYLAVRTWRGRDRLERPRPRPKPLSRVYLDGMLVNLLNPKVILFFLAFLPQFVDQGAGAVPLQITALGLITGLLGLVSDMVYVLVAGSLGDRLRARPVVARWRSRATAAVYLCLGATAALAGPHAAASPHRAT